MSEEQKFPSEVVELPSEGKLYPKDSPLSEGKIELKSHIQDNEDISYFVGKADFWGGEQMIGAEMNVHNSLSVVH